MWELNILRYIRSEEIAVPLSLVILQLVEKFKGDCPSQWPGKTVIILSTHEESKHRDMSAVAIITSIGIHTDTHLVPPRAGIEWRTIE